MTEKIVLLVRDPVVRNLLSQKFRERHHEVIPRFQSEGSLTLLKNDPGGAVFFVGNDITDADPQLLARKASAQFPHHLVI